MSRQTLDQIRATLEVARKGLAFAEKALEKYEEKAAQEESAIRAGDILIYGGTGTYFSTPYREVLLITADSFKLRTPCGKVFHVTGEQRKDYTVIYRPDEGAA